FFFGSLDAASFISVDKPPASLWIMELSGRLFGFGTWSMLVPQALEGVAAVGLLYAAVRRWYGGAAGLLGGVGLALTPAAALAVAGLAVVVAAGWWVAAVALTPAADRPFVGGSTNNSILQLAFGYNGLSRITGSSTGAGIGGGGAPGGGGAGFGGPAGIARLFDGTWGGDVAWLVPAALACLLAGLWLTRRNGRTDGPRAGLLIWGGWMPVTGLVFRFAGGSG